MFNKRMDFTLRGGMTVKEQLMAAGLVILILAGLSYIIYLVIKVREYNFEPVKLPENMEKDI